MFACVCGYREKLSDFKKRKAGKAAGKGEIRRYLAKQEQQEDKGSPLWRSSWPNGWSRAVKTDSDITPGNCGGLL